MPVSSPAPPRGRGSQLDVRPRRLFEIDFRRASLDAATGQTLALTRAGAARCVSGDGIVHRVVTSRPRWHEVNAGDGTKYVTLLVEPTDTSEAPQSEDFSTTWTTSGVSVSTNTTTAPDGKSTADTITEDGTTGTHIVDSGGLGVAASTKFVMSLFAKKKDRDWIVLETGGTRTPGLKAWFNLNTGAVGTTSGPSSGDSTIDGSYIEDVGDGWYRCVIQITTGSGGVGVQFQPGLADADGSDSYTGDGSSGNYFWGAQGELGVVASSYIPTTTADVSRPTDALTSPFYGKPRALTMWASAIDQGIFQAKAEARALVMTGPGNSLTPADGVLLQVDASDNLLFTVRSGGTAYSSSVALSTLGASPLDRVDVAGEIAASGGQFTATLNYSKNGAAFAAAAASSAFDLPSSWTGSQLNFGSRGDGTSGGHAAFRSVALWPGSVTGAKLKTAYD